MSDMFHDDTRCGNRRVGIAGDVYNEWVEVSGTNCPYCGVES